MKEVREVFCMWCGNNFVKTKPNQCYCSEHCRSEARKEKSRNRSRKYYYAHKQARKELKDKGSQLGTGSLGEHRNDDEILEHELVGKEKRRLRITKVVFYGDKKS